MVTGKPGDHFFKIHSQIQGITVVGEMFVTRDFNE